MMASRSGPDRGLRQLARDLVALPGNSHGYFEMRIFERQLDPGPWDNLRALLTSADYPYSEYTWEVQSAARRVDERAFAEISGKKAAAALHGWVEQTNALDSFIGPGAASAEAERRASLPALAAVVEPYASLLSAAQTVFANEDYDDSPVRSVYSWHREWIMIEQHQIRCLSAFLD
jgi:hypothetical protein